MLGRLQFLGRDIFQRSPQTRFRKGEILTVPEKLKKEFSGKTNLRVLEVTCEQGIEKLIFAEKPMTLYPASMF